MELDAEHPIDPGGITLGAWLRTARLDRGLSQESVAFGAGIDVSTYARLERDLREGEVRDIRVGTVVSILRSLRVSPEQMEKVLSAYW